MLRRCLVALLFSTIAAACASGPEEGTPVATPSVTLPPAAAIESPVNVGYRFVVAADAPPLAQNYRVFVHFSDPSGQQLWTDDHLPPTPTTQWKPGATIAYTRTMFVPKVPYSGETTVDVGLYLPRSNERVPLSGTSVGQRAYRVGTLTVQPQSATTLVSFASGWHAAEAVPDAPGVEWHWSKRESSVQFRNPRQDVMLMLDLDQPQADLPGPQQVELRAGSTVVDSFALAPGERVVRRVAIPAAALGTSDSVEVTLTVSPTFSPAYLPGATSQDVRTLGVRVFHAYLEPGVQPK